MRKLLTLFIALGLMAGSVATAEAAKDTKRSTSEERTVRASYGPYQSPVTGCHELLGPYACLVIDTRASESSLTAKVTDRHGQPVFVEVTTDLEGTIGTFCGETTRPIAFQPGSTLYFYLSAPGWPGNLLLDCPANRIKTTGTLSVTLSDFAPERSESAPEVRPARSGSILSGTGWLLDGVVGGCQMSPECAAWLQNDCSLALAGWNPGFTASIEDVDDLADGPPVERVFRFGSGDPGLAWGGVHLQFWSADCAEVPNTRRRLPNSSGDGSGRDSRFRIPPDARWMTVTGYQDSVNLTWTLN